MIIYAFLRVLSEMYYEIRNLEGEVYEEDMTFIQSKSKVSSHQQKSME